QAAATIKEGLHHLGAGGAQFFVAADIEGDPGPQTDGRNFLTCGRDRLFQDRPWGKALAERWKCRRRREASDRADECAARQMIHGYHMTCLTVVANGRCRCRGGQTASAPSRHRHYVGRYVAPSGQLAHAARTSAPWPALSPAPSPGFSPPSSGSCRHPTRP